MVWVESNLYPTTCHFLFPPLIGSIQSGISQVRGIARGVSLLVLGSLILVSSQKYWHSNAKKHSAFKPYLLFQFWTCQNNTPAKQDCYLSGLIVEYDLLTIGDHVAIGSGSLGWIIDKTLRGESLSAWTHGCCLEVAGCFKTPFFEATGVLFFWDVRGVLLDSMFDSRMKCSSWKDRHQRLLLPSLILNRESSEVPKT